MSSSNARSISSFVGLVFPETAPSRVGETQELGFMPTLESLSSSLMEPIWLWNLMGKLSKRAWCLPKSPANSDAHHFGSETHQTSHHIVSATYMCLVSSDQGLTKPRKTARAVACANSSEYSKSSLYPMEAQASARVVKLP